MKLYNFSSSEGEQK